MHGETLKQRNIISYASPLFWRPYLLLFS